MRPKKTRKRSKKRRTRNKKEYNPIRTLDKKREEQEKKKEAKQLTNENNMERKEDPFLFFLEFSFRQTSLAYIFSSFLLFLHFLRLCFPFLSEFS